MAQANELSVLREEKEITGLIHLLDTQILKRSLQEALPGQTIVSLQKHYIRYKPGTSILVRYRLQTSQADYDIYAKSYSPDHSKLSNSHKKKIQKVVDDIGIIFLPKYHIEIYFFPNDARLRTLQRLQDEKRRYSLLKKVLSNNSGNKSFRYAEMTTLQYKPERRYVACLTTKENKKAVLKAYRPSAYVNTLAHIKQLEALGITRFSALIGHHDKYQVLLFKWRDGKTMTECWQESDFNLVLLTKLAKQLAEFHHGSWQQVVEPRKNNLTAIVRGLAHLTPHLHDDAQLLSKNLNTALQGVAPLEVRCHGDFYAKQIICEADELYWLDLDDISLAHPGRDIGTFVAHLEWDVIRGRLTEEQAKLYESVFVNAYLQESYHEIPREHLNTMIALHLFQLIHHPFRNCQTNWVEQIEILLTRVTRRLQQSNPEPLTEAALMKPAINATLNSHQQRSKVVNPFDLSNDQPLLSLLEKALDPQRCINLFKKHLPNSIYDHSQLDAFIRLEHIEVVRYKKGKRLLLKYHLKTQSGSHALVGKIRAKGLHRSVYRINQQLNDSHDLQNEGWQVPEPICMIPECNMWLQRYVSGVEFTQLVGGLSTTNKETDSLAERIATMSHSLHKSRLFIAKVHGIQQELDVLKKQLFAVADVQAAWESDIHKLYALLEEYATPLSDRPQCCIHRDFYPDQIIVDEQQLYLLDLDLFCMGDPCLDIGNFVAHVQEQALREQGHLDAYQALTNPLIKHYLALAGNEEQNADAIERYRLLSLARHIAISQRIPDRSSLTPFLLKYCLEQVVKSCQQEK